MLKSIILQQKEERDLLLTKDYQKRIPISENEIFLQSGLIKLISGPRRAGKSVFALQLLKGHPFAYLNFDDDLLLKKFDEELVFQSLLEVYPAFEYLLLDEIQNLTNWELWVGKLYRRGINLIITGSNANLLSSEMATALTGRYVQITLLPFCFAEAIDFKNIRFQYETPTGKAMLLNELHEFMVMGGYPETIRTREIMRNYLSALFDSILLKDITKRFKVRNTNELYNLASYLLANFTTPLSMSRITADLALRSVNTVQKFNKYLSETYLFFFLPRFNSKLKLMQKADTKIYVVDNGFVYARAFELSDNWGKLLENMVFIELIRQGYTIGQTIFYYRTRNNREIDFVCRKGHKVDILIQVSYDISSQKTLKRETTALIEASEELKCNNMLIITYDEERTIELNRKKVQVIPSWKWLLPKASELRESGS